jgi:hypothetical protein
VIGRRMPDDEVDRLLREALADDLPRGLEVELRREARLSWRRAASEPRRARWQDWIGASNAWRFLLPQPALVAAALAMLAAGAVMQAAPSPPGVVESFQGRQASALAARALERATAMACAVEVGDDRGRLLSYRIDWKAPGDARVRLDGTAGPVERALRVPVAGPSVLTRTATTRNGTPRDPALDPARAYLSPSALGELLAAPWRPAPGAEAAPGTETFFVSPRPGPPGLTVTIDAATRLPLRLDGTDRDGRTQAAVCRWP